MADVFKILQEKLATGTNKPEDFPPHLRELFVSRYPSEIILTVPFEVVPVVPSADLQLDVKAAPMVQITGRWRMPTETADKFFSMVMEQVQWDHIGTAPDDDPAANAWASDVAAQLKIYQPH